MSEFMLIDAKAPATMESVVEAITRLSTFGEAEILELVSAGKLKSLFPFRTLGNHPLPADFADEEDLVEASAIPLTSKQRRALIKSSVPAAEVATSELEPVKMTEVGTKLDLARAYIDMGDPHGALSILEEVIREELAGPNRESSKKALPAGRLSDKTPSTLRKRDRSTSE
jgi:FimV-like protein